MIDHFRSLTFETYQNNKSERRNLERWAENIIVLESKVSGIEGKTIAEIAQEWNDDPWDVYFDIIAKDPYTRGATGSMGPRTPYLQYWTHPKGMVGLDTSVFDAD